MQIDNVLKEFKDYLRDLYGNRLKAVILYGSWARGEATDDSDIDLAIVLSDDVVPGKEIDRMIDVITDINLDYGVLISVYPVSETKYEKVKSPLLMNLRSEGVTI
jgi:predicted nucleotidyltransferase